MFSWEQSLSVKYATTCDWTNCSPEPPPAPSYSKPAILQKCKKALFIWIFNFLKLKYPPRLIESTINSFIHSQGQAEPQHQIPLELSCCSKIRGRSTLYKKISARKLEEICAQNFPVEKSFMTTKGVEAKPPLINQHCVVYKFSCDLCNRDYVGHTSRHLFQRITEHKHSSVGKHLKEEHSLQPTSLQDQFTVLKKCRTKFDCLIYQMLLVRSIKSKLNRQSNSICTQIFT